MSKGLLRVWFFSIILIILSGCGSDTIIVCDSNSSSPTIESSALFKVTGVNVRLIETAMKKYEIDSKESAVETEDDRNALEDLISSLEVITKTDGHLENLDNPISLQTGKFYNFEMVFNSQISFPKGLSFEFKLVDAKLDGSYNKIIDYGGTDELNETGENSLSIDTLIPTDVPNGEYILLMNVIDERIIVDDNKLDIQNIKSVAQLGSIYIKVYSDSDSKRVEVVDSVGEDYIDLSKSMEFDNGYTMEPIGWVRFINYNSSHLEQNITLSAKLELEDGSVFELGILDVYQSKVTNETTHQISVLNPNEVDVGDFTLNYYIKDIDYATLLSLVPDLSEDNNSDGINGTIKWSIKAQDSDTIMNDIQDNIVLSKYDDNFAYSAKKVESNKKYRSIVPPRLTYSIISNSKYGNRAGIIKDWTSPKDDFKDFNLTNVDAALDYDKDSAYIFSGDKYIKVFKKDFSVSGLRSISSNWKGVTFKKIDAVFNDIHGKLYFFSGDKYIIYDVATDKADTAELDIRKDWLGLLDEGETISAAVTSYSEVNVWFFIGNKIKCFDISHKSDETNDDYHSEELKYLYKTLKFPLDATMKHGNEIILFRNKSLTEEIKSLWSQGILFKVDKSYDKKYGNHDKAASDFSLKYGTIGNWKELYVRAYGDSSLNTYLFGTKNVIFDIKSEVNAGVKAKYKSSNPNEKSRIGAKLKIAVLNNTWYEKDTITEDNKTETVTDEDNESKKTAIEKSKEASKNKGFSLPNKEWKEERLLFVKSFMAGPIPLSIAGGIDGKLTLNSAFELDGIGAYLTGKVEGKIDGFIKGGLDAYILKITLDIDSTFGDTQIDGKVGAKIDINDKNEFYFGLGADLNTTIKLLKVSLKINAKVGVGWFSKEGTINIWDSPWAFNQTYKLLNYELPLISIPDEKLFN